jgi:Arc/MetJ-type ribon-helix-helix transcriptional regulator
VLSWRSRSKGNVLAASGIDGVPLPERVVLSHEKRSNDFLPAHDASGGTSRHSRLAECVINCRLAAGLVPVEATFGNYRTTCLYRPPVPPPYQVPSDIEQRIRAEVESGEFETADDVLREAIDTLERRQRGLQAARDMVREADDDIAAGRVASFNAEESKKFVRRRLRAHGIED